MILAMGFLTVVNLAWYGGMFMSTQNPPQSQIFLPGLPDVSAQLVKQPPVIDVTLPLRRILPVLIVVIIIGGAGVVGTIFLFARQRQKKGNDRRRLTDLEALAAGFEKYFERHGHYPVSATYDSQYYSAINIITEWKSYNFPPAEEMREFMADWPPCDPAFDPQSADQEGNYLYYPHHFGQRFSLYAFLEAPTQHPIPDYTIIDQLPNTTVKYNYRLNGPDHHVETPQPAPNPTATAEPVDDSAPPPQA